MFNVFRRFFNTLFVSDTRHDKLVRELADEILFQLEPKLIDRETARCVILSELEILSGKEAGKRFIEQSGIAEKEIAGAVIRLSDGANDAWRMLVYLTSDIRLKIHEDDAKGIPLTRCGFSDAYIQKLITDTKIAVLDRIMKRWRIGHYAQKGEEDRGASYAP